MKRFTKISFALAFVIALGVISGVGVNPVVEAQENNQQESSGRAEQQPATPASYKYIAQPGDSYAQMARKAVQTYGIVKKVELSEAQIVYVETYLTNDAGSPNLTVGQEVSIQQSDVEQWVNKAKNLSEADEAAWNYYVQFVDFNTDSVGEAA